MKPILKILILTLLTLSSCGDSKKSDSKKDDTCSPGYWCEGEKTKVFYRTNLFTYVPYPNTTSDVILRYIKSSKTFELQIKIETPYKYELYKIGNGDRPKIEILEGEGRNQVVTERVRILDMTDDKISFQSSILEKSFNERGKYEFHFDLELPFGRETELGVYMKL